MELADNARVLQVPLSTPEWWREFDRKYLSSLRADGMSLVFWQLERQWPWKRASLRPGIIKAIEV